MLGTRRETMGYVRQHLRCVPCVAALPLLPLLPPLLLDEPIAGAAA